MAPPSPVYSLSGVSLAFGEREVLSGLDLEIRAGESFTIVGPGGEGKTVLLKVLAGLTPPSGGRVWFEGEPLYGAGARARAALARRIGMAFQKGGLFDSMSAGENLRFPLREILRTPRRECGEKVAKALADVGLEGQEGLEVSELSGGMQKRLGIARALILAPEVALFDDPTAGLDPITSRAILDLVKRIKARTRMTLVTVTSDLGQAYALSDRLGFLYGGRFREIGTPEEFRTSRDPVVRQFVEGSLEGPLTDPEEIAP